jgi:hypothetical protein
MLGTGAHGRGTLTDLASFFSGADLTDALRGRRIIAAYVNDPDVRGAVIPIDNDHKGVINVSFSPDKGQSADDFTPSAASNRSGPPSVSPTCAPAARPGGSDHRPGSAPGPWPPGGRSW